MNKISLATTLSALLVCGAMAQSAKSTKVPTTIHCAVMSTSVVNIAKATKNHQYADFKGRRYFFCCGDCPAEFSKNPSKFAKSESIKAPAAPKKVK